MRRALTLIELIFSMMIVAVVFTIVPKILFATNKSFEAVVKEEALYNAMALTGLIASLPWDEANTDSDAILAASGGGEAYRCDATTGFYRIGGFSGGRNCLAEGGTPPEASATLEREDAYYNDLDDYDGYQVDATTPKGARYTLSVKVSYLQDPSPGEEVDLSALAPATEPTDLKEVAVTVRYAPAYRKSPFVKTITYVSANIGQTYIRRRRWR
ncbi:type II secretion system protein [Hydrogenimonas sp.]